MAENCRCSISRLLKMALNELYYNLSVFVTLWLNYYDTGTLSLGTEIHLKGMDFAPVKYALHFTGQAD